MFVCGDQLLRGAALNAVLIAKLVTAPVPRAPPMPNAPLSEPLETMREHSATPFAAFGVGLLAGALIGVSVLARRQTR